MTYPEQPLLVARQARPHTVPSVSSDRSASCGPKGSAWSRPQGRLSPRSGRRASSGQDGFTLVELLVVVLVLGTLVGIAVPTFVQQRDGAWDAAVRSELRAASIALASYRAQNGVYAAAALTTGAGWGYEPSSDIIVAVEFPTDRFCLRGWYRSNDEADVETGSSEALALADTRAEWVATPTGIESLAGTTPKSCPT